MGRGLAPAQAAVAASVHSVRVASRRPRWVRNRSGRLWSPRIHRTVIWEQCEGFKDRERMIMSRAREGSERYRAAFVSVRECRGGGREIQVPVHEIETPFKEFLVGGIAELVKRGGDPDGRALRQTQAKVGGGGRRRSWRSPRCSWERGGTGPACWLREWGNRRPEFNGSRPFDCSRIAYMRKVLILEAAPKPENRFRCAIRPIAFFR